MEREEAQEYARENSIIHMETSAKTALNVKALFEEIGEPDTMCVFVCYLTVMVWKQNSEKTAKDPSSARPRSISNRSSTAAEKVVLLDDVTT